MKIRKRWWIIGILLLAALIVAGLGLKYFPFTRIMKMPASKEAEFVDPQKTVALPPNTLSYDFELPPGKEMPGGFYKGIAHSGKYSVKAFGQNSFSVAVERTAGQIGLQNLGAVALSAWIYVFPTDKEVKGNFVFTASNEVGVNVCWEAIWLVEPEIPRGKWFKISKYIDLTPVKFKPEYKIQVYFWNNSSTDILVDDYFIAFGGPVDRRGDSARVDLTKPEGFRPAFNLPPFPVRFLQRLADYRMPGNGAIGPDDPAVAGDFLGSGRDLLFVSSKKGQASLLVGCPDRKEFRRVPFPAGSLPSVCLPLRTVLKGKFMAGKGEQLLLAGDKGWALASVSLQNDPCSGDGAAAARLHVTGSEGRSRGVLTAGDFDGDGRTELLEITSDGRWWMKSFQAGSGKPGEWQIVASGSGGIRPAGNEGMQETVLSAGPFLPGSSRDRLLVVSRPKGGTGSSYALLNWNNPGKQWESSLRKGDGASALTIGLDTLRPADQFLTLPGSGGGPVLLRYNRDWRFDLKEIRFNDTTFQVVTSIDFRGYEGSRNPKYYESLRLIPGRFFDPASTLCLVSGRIDPSRKYGTILPDFTEIYTLLPAE